MAYYLFPQVISKKECKNLLKYALRESDFSSGTVLDNNSSRRNCSVSFLNSKDNILNEIMWGFVHHANDEMFRYNLEHFQSLQFSKYEKGNYYDWHRDVVMSEKEKIRKLSLSFSITDHNHYEGGNLEFFAGEDKKSIDFSNDLSEKIRKVGTVIVFDSREWHRVTPVTKGVRYSVVCWTVGPHFV